jgi:hypothetical protein
MRHIALNDKGKTLFLASLDVLHRRGSENLARLKSTATVRLEACYLALVKWGLK